MVERNIQVGKTYLGKGPKMKPRTVTGIRKMPGLTMVDYVWPDGTGSYMTIGGFATWARSILTDGPLVLLSESDTAAITERGKALDAADRAAFRAAGGMA